MQFIDRLIKKARALDAQTQYPIIDTALTVWRRLQQDRLGVTASSLTFTTVLALVPFFAVVLSVFTAFPEFAQLRDALHDWLVKSLIPASIAESVLDYLEQFAQKASSLGLIGFAGLFFTTVSLLLTIDHTLNDLWRVKTQRPLGQRLLIYWAALTLGPLLLGASLAITSYVVSHSTGLLPGISGLTGFALGVLQWLLLGAGMALMFRHVPNTTVRWAHAAAGGMFASTCMVAMRWGMGLYLAHVPSYSLIYGTFATVPLLLMWMYASWMIVLIGAVIAAYLPLVAKGVQRMGDSPGWDFQMAAEALQALGDARSGGGHGLDTHQLAARLDVDPLLLMPALDALQHIGWTGRLAPTSADAQPRHILLVDEPQNQPLAPLVQRLLLAPDRATASLWRQPHGWANATLADLLDRHGPQTLSLPGKGRGGADADERGGAHADARGGARASGDAGAPRQGGARGVCGVRGDAEAHAKAAAQARSADADAAPAGRGAGSGGTPEGPVMPMVLGTLAVAWLARRLRR